MFCLAGGNRQTRSIPLAFRGFLFSFALVLYPPLPSLSFFSLSFFFSFLETCFGQQHRCLKRIRPYFTRLFRAFVSPSRRIFAIEISFVLLLANYSFFFLLSCFFFFFFCKRKNCAGYRFKSRLMKLFKAYYQLIRS